MGNGFVGPKQVTSATIFLYARYSLSSTSHKFLFCLPGSGTCYRKPLASATAFRVSKNPATRHNSCRSMTCVDGTVARYDMSRQVIFEDTSPHVTLLKASLKCTNDKGEKGRYKLMFISCSASKYFSYT